LVRVLAVFCGALIVLYLLGGILGKAVSVVTTPVYIVRHWLAESSATVPLYLRSRNELLAQISALDERLAATGNGEAMIAQLTAENDELRGLLSIHDDVRIGAGVIARPPYLPYDALLIDRGSTDGITENAIVYYAHDRSIGVVSHVFTHSALVSLFSTPGMTSTVYVIGPDVFTTAYGEGSGVVRVTIPQGIPLSEGNAVILPSLEVGVLGVVSAVESVSTQPEQNGYVTFDVPLQSVRTVSVSTRKIETVNFDDAQAYMANLDYDALMIDVPEIYRMPVSGNASGTPSSTPEQSN
jgi:cell shape-determining protein MreC